MSVTVQTILDAGGPAAGLPIINANTTALASAINTEETNRSAADASLAASLTAEQGTRSTADASLATALTTEAGARSTADASLTTALALKAPTAGPVFTSSFGFADAGFTRQGVGQIYNLRSQDAGTLLSSWNTNAGVAAYSGFGTWNGTVGLNIYTFGSGHATRANKTRIYTNAAYSISFGANNLDTLTLNADGSAAFAGALSVAGTPLGTAAFSATGDFAAASHTHPQSEVTNLVSDLALKAPLASPAFTGNATVVGSIKSGTSSYGGSIDIDGPDATTKFARWLSAGKRRFTLAAAANTASISWDYYDVSETWVSTPWKWVVATNQHVFGGGMSISGGINSTPIGAVTPSTAAFTTLSASTALTVAGTNIITALGTKQDALSNAATLARITEAASLPLWNGAAWPGGSGGGASQPTDAAVIAGTDTTASAPSAAQLKLAAQTWGGKLYGAASKLFAADKNGDKWMEFELCTLVGHAWSPVSAQPFSFFNSGGTAFDSVSGYNGIRYLATGTTTTGKAGIGLHTWNSGKWGPMRTASGAKVRAWAIIPGVSGSNNPTSGEAWSWWMGYATNGTSYCRVVFDINGFHIEHCNTGTVTSSASYAYSLPVIGITTTTGISAYPRILFESTVLGTSNLYLNETLICTLSSGWWASGVDSNNSVLESYILKSAGTTSAMIGITHIGFGISS